MPELDDMLLEEAERASHEYKLDAKQARVVEWIRKNLPIAGFANLIGEELWLREIIKDLEKPGPARSQALKMLGEYLGVLGKRTQAGKLKTVTIDEE